MAIVYKPGQRHTDTDCLLQSPIETTGTDDVDVDAAVLGIVDAVTISPRAAHTY